MRDRYASVHLDVEPHRTPASAAAERAERPFDIVLLGDLSARQSRGEHRVDLSGVRPIRIDRDDFDAVLQRHAPRLRLTLDAEAAPLEITFEDIDDFHPDSLYLRAPLFARLRDLRRRANDPAELRAVAEALGHGEPSATLAPPSRPPDPATTSPPQSGGSVLDLILDESAPVPVETTAEAVLAPGGDLSTLIRRLVAPYRVPRPDPRQAELLTSIDAALSDGMRRLLHHSAFQAIEALWRGVFMLVRRVETDRLLRVHLLDVTEAELEESLQEPQRAMQMLTPAGGGGEASEPPALLVVLRTASESERDLTLLRQLAGLCRRSGSVCLTAADAALVGVPETALLSDPRQWNEPPAAWRELRSDPAATALGICLPGFLLREPYGADADECERFPFEEHATDPRDEEFLWGNGALACAILLAQSFSDDGWAMRPGSRRDLTGLPLPLVREGGDVVARPAAEAILPDDAVEGLLDRGIIPIAASREGGTIRIVRYQSTAEPPAALAGRWSSAPPSAP